MLHGGSGNNYRFSAVPIPDNAFLCVGEIFDLAVNIGDEPIKASRYNNAESCGAVSCSFLN